MQVTPVTQQKSSAIDLLGRGAARLHIRPLAVRSYEVAKAIEYRLRGPTYRVTAGPASARFLIPTKNEFLDFNRIRERPILEELLGELRPEDTFYDLGANLGLYSCLAADVADRVVAFEPHPENADRLEQNASLNGADDLVVYRCALADSNGTAELQVALDGLGSAGHSLVKNPDGVRTLNPQTVTVETRSGDDLVDAERLPRPSVLKIDVEGAEYDVLSGLRETLSDPECRLVYCEVHPKRLGLQSRSVDDVRVLLEACGFEVDDRSVRPDQPFLRARKMPATRAQH